MNLALWLKCHNKCGSSIVTCSHKILQLSLQNNLWYFRELLMTLCRREFAKRGASGIGTMIDLFFPSLAVPLHLCQKHQTILYLKQYKGRLEKFEETLTENSKCSLLWESIPLAPLVEAISHIEGRPTLPHIGIPAQGPTAVIVSAFLATQSGDHTWPVGHCVGWL